jgi:xylose isomerase
MHNYRFSVGPWNISEGRDPYGPETRPVRDFSWKLDQFKSNGIDAIMFHDDDVVPDIDTKTSAQVLKEAAEVRRRVEGAGMSVEMVAPRLWFSPMTVDGAYTSNNAKARQYALDRSLQTIDIADVMGTDLIVLWLAREGTYVRESKSYARSLEYLVEATNRMLAHNPKIRLAIEPKPNEPVDVAYLPTIGHTLAFAHLTSDPARVGCTLETAHCILAGLDPADEIEFALAQKKLWSLHLNDQNGLKFDQDKPFGSVNLRTAFDQVRVLERHRFGADTNACIAFDVHSFRTTSGEQSFDHIVNSRKTFKRLLEKVRSFDEKQASQLIAALDYQALDQLVLDHLLG